MKKLFLFLFCIPSLHIWAQQRDSLLNELKSMKETRSEIFTKLEEVKKAKANKFALIEKLNEKYNSLLVMLDSVTGEKIELDKKKQLTKTQEKRLDDISLRIEKLKSQLIRIEHENEEIHNKYSSASNETETVQKVLDQLDTTIKKLEASLK